MSEHGSIFLSYRSIEADFALMLAADLKNAGVNLWVDRLDIHPGQDWLQALADALDHCRAMIAVLTPEYVASRYCRRERARVDRLERPIIPVLLKPLQPKEWPYEIERHQMLDFTGWRDEVVYAARLAELLHTLRAQFGDGFAPIPDAETRYLTRLIAELEASKSVIEFSALYAQAERLTNQEIARPQPHLADAWLTDGDYSVAGDPGADSSPWRPQPSRAIPLHGIDEAVKRHPRFVLTGGPGTGKTTTIQQLVLMAAHARRRDPSTAPLPFLIRLTRWDDGQTAEEFIRSEWPLETDPIPLLKSGDVTLYLDGLNDLGPAGGDKARQLRDFLHGERAPRRAIITCRTDAYTADVDLHLPVVRAAELDRTRIEQFVRAYLGDDADRLLAQILPDDEQAGENARHLFQLARNPFLLSVLTLIFLRSPERELPRNRGTLLKELAAELWRQETAHQPDAAPRVEALETALSRLAFAMIDEGQPVYVARTYALARVGDQTLLRTAIGARFLEEEGDYLRFSHQLMQEYFAALGLARDGLPTRLTVPRFDAHRRRIPGKWDAVIVALCGINPNADLVVRAVAEVDPYLALECVASGVAVSEHTAEHAVEIVLRLHDEGSGSPVTAGRLLAALGHEAAPSILLAAMRSGTWAARSEAHDLLAGLGFAPHESLIAALLETDPAMHEATATALRQIGAEAMPGLLALLRHEQWALRRAAAWALRELHDSAAVPALAGVLHDLDPLVAAEAAAALGWIGDPAAVSPLLDALRHGHWRVRRSAAVSLGWLGAQAVGGLADALRDDDLETRRLAVHALTDIADPAAVPALIEASYDPSSEVRNAAIDALTRSEDKRAVNRLIELLSDNAVARWLKSHIARVLEATGRHDARKAAQGWRAGRAKAPSAAATSATPTGAKSAPGKTPGKKPSTAQQGKNRLGQIKKGGTQAAPRDPLKELESIDWMVRRNAVRHLSNVDPRIALPRLMHALKDEDNQVRMTAVQVLGGIKSDVALEGLLSALGDQDTIVCDAAAVALAKLGKSVIPGLLNALGSKNVNLRGAAVETLGKIGDTSTVPALVALLNDTAQPWLAQQRICDLSARALLAIGTPEARGAVKKWQNTPVGAEFTHKPPTIHKSTVPDEETQPAPALKSQAAADTLEGLLETLRHGAWGVRENAAKDLRNYARKLREEPNPLDLQRLAAAIDEDDWVVRWAASEALAWAGDKASVPALVKRLDDPQWMVRIAVVRGLLELGDPLAVPALMDRASDDNANVREAIAEALGGLGDPRAIPALTTMLADEERFVRFAAAEALGRLGDARIVGGLVNALDDDDLQVRWAAAEALGRIKDTAAVPPLIDLLDDDAGPGWEDRQVCDIAAEALEAIGTPEARQAVAEWRQKRDTTAAAAS